MRSLIITSLFFLIFHQNIFAQSGVGIGTDQVHNSAILQIESSTKGVLFPSVESDERAAINTPANGLTVYDPDERAFYYYDSLNATTGSWKRLVQENSYGTVPIGGIIMWSGDLGSLPENFALCDGDGITPDLTDKFVFSGDSPGLVDERVEITDALSDDYTTGDAESNCSEFEFLWSGTLTFTFPGGGLTYDPSSLCAANVGSVYTITDKPAANCSESLFGGDAALLMEICPWYIITDCSSIPNDNYYLLNTACRTAAQYYELAFIMRVE